MANKVLVIEGGETTQGTPINQTANPPTSGALLRVGDAGIGSTGVAVSGAGPLTSRYPSSASGDSVYSIAYSYSSSGIGDISANAARWQWASGHAMGHWGRLCAYEGTLWFQSGRLSTGAGSTHIVHHTGNITKTTGSDDDYPISQKAASDAIAAKVTGPASSTTNHLVAFDGTTGKLIKSAGNVAATSTTDSTIGRFARIGDFGLGHSDVLNNVYNNSNLNNQSQRTGFFAWSSSASNTPISDGCGLYIARTQFGDGNRVMFGKNSNRTFVQYRTSSGGGTMGASTEIVTSETLLTGTGSSEAMPMTQKAVTDALGTKAALRATSTVDGGVRMRIASGVLYITNDGTDA